jgi:murein DD-endopeptidase MepM/ murein hydrolase activator NlpD
VQKIILWLLLLGALCAKEAINGKITIIEFDTSATLALQKKGVSLPLLDHPSRSDKRIVLVAIPYRQKEAISLLHVKRHETTGLTLHVTQGGYKQEQLSVAPKYVAPSKETLARIAKEREEALEIYRTFTPKRHWNDTFTLPLESTITSTYGNARVFNGTLQSYHSGTDFRAPIGTPIKATNDGVVVLAKARYYAGGSVIIDHGEGIYSVYYHLSDFSVPVGKVVKRGEVIGLSGNSGRVTGPHLHFGLMVQSTPIAPLDFIEKINALF